MFKVFPKRKQEKTRARREGGEQWVSVLPQDRDINAETAAEPQRQGQGSDNHTLESKIWSLKRQKVPRNQTLQPKYLHIQY